MLLGSAVACACQLFICVKNSAAPHLCTYAFNMLACLLVSQGFLFLHTCHRLPGCSSQDSCQPANSSSLTADGYISGVPSHLGPSYKSKSRDLHISRNVNLEIFYSYKPKISRKKSRDFWRSPRNFFCKVNLEIFISRD